MSILQSEDTVWLIPYVYTIVRRKSSSRDYRRVVGVTGMFLCPHRFAARSWGVTSSSKPANPAVNSRISVVMNLAAQQRMVGEDKHMRNLLWEHELQVLQVPYFEFRLAAVRCLCALLVRVYKHAAYTGKLQQRPTRKLCAQSGYMCLRAIAGGAASR